MTTINVQFSDATETVVTGYAGCPQDENTWPHQGVISVSDPRWKTYYDAQHPAIIQPYLPEPASD